MAGRRIAVALRFQSAAYGCFLKVKVELDPGGETRVTSRLRLLPSSEGTRRVLVTTSRLWRISIITRVGPLYQKETSSSLSLHSWPSTPQARSTVFSLAPDSEILMPSSVCWIDRVSNFSLPSWVELSCHVPLSSGRSAAKAAPAAKVITRSKGRTLVSVSRSSVSPTDPRARTANSL